jgi:putative endonuclease
MKSSGKSIGRQGESIAADFLEAKGYTILARNWRSPYGEIDLIASQDNAVAFVEVKTRTTKSLGPPEISITHTKGGHMHDTAEYYIQQHPEMSNDWRIDVITIQIRYGNNPPLIDHFENVIS